MLLELLSVMFNFTSGFAWALIMLESGAGTQGFRSEVLDWERLSSLFHSR